MKKRKGFTLVEVFIVITVIGILASMMMMSSSETVSTAKANNIITSLRNFSMATMAFYTDSMDHFGKTPNSPTDLKGWASKYMHNDGDIPDKDKYIITNNSGTWWAGFNLTDIADGKKIREKLEGRAEGANLKGTTTNTPPAKDSAEIYNYTKNNHTYVWLLIRSSKK